MESPTELGVTGPHVAARKHTTLGSKCTFIIVCALLSHSKGLGTCVVVLVAIKSKVACEGVVAEVSQSSTLADSFRTDVRRTICVIFTWIPRV